MSLRCSLPISRFAPHFVVFPFSDPRFDACRRPLPSSSLCCLLTFLSSTSSQPRPCFRSSDYALLQRREIQLHGGSHVDYTISCHCSSVCVSWFSLSFARANKYVTDSLGFLTFLHNSVCIQFTMLSQLYHPSFVHLALPTPHGVEIAVGATFLPISPHQFRGS